MANATFGFLLVFLGIAAILAGAMACYAGLGFTLGWWS